MAHHLRIGIKISTSYFEPMTFFLTSDHTVCYKYLISRKTYELLSSGKTTLTSPVSDDVLLPDNISDSS
jgi:hypothetical protein